MKIIAVTGSIGTGKSTCCKILSIHGYPIYYADARAKELMNESPTLKQQIINHFGQHIYSQGVLQRKQLAEIVFQDPEQLKHLNQFVHPAVQSDFKQWIESRRSEAHPAVFEEAALTFEAGQEKTFDRIICVVSPPDVALKRVAKRDATTPAKIKERLRNQWPQSKKARLSNGIILNDGQHSLIFQLKNLIDRWELR